MKKLFALFFATFLTFGTVLAQDGEEITDEQLWKYALLNEVVDQMKAEISTVINEMIKNQEGIDGNRYLELAKTGGDEAKLAEIEAKDFEKQFLDVVDNAKEERIEAIKTVNQILATKMLGDGGKVYKAIKSALSSDESVKARYDAILAQIQLPEGE